MARGKLLKVEASKEEETAKQDSLLEELDISIDDPVRFRQFEGQNWTKAKVKGSFKDGSVTLIDDSGMWRSIMPTSIQKQVPKPKRGFEWKELIDQETS